MDAIRTYPNIPSTFDGSLPSETFGTSSGRVLIGERYIFEDHEGQQVAGTVSTACVDEPASEVIFAITTDAGNSILLRRPMSEQDLTDYRRHPEAYFGQIVSVSKPAKNVYELFEFFMSSYKDTPRNRLLELMSLHPNLVTLMTLSDDDLRMEYCEWCVAMLDAKTGPQNPA